MPSRIPPGSKVLHPYGNKAISRAMIDPLSGLGPPPFHLRREMKSCPDHPISSFPGHVSNMTPYQIRSPGYYKFAKPFVELLSIIRSQRPIVVLKSMEAGHISIKAFLLDQRSFGDKLGFGIPPNILRSHYHLLSGRDYYIQASWNDPGHSDLTSNLVCMCITGTLPGDTRESYNIIFSPLVDPDHWPRGNEPGSVLKFHPSYYEFYLGPDPILESMWKEWSVETTQV